jgi:2-iminoacetate synthase
MNAAVPEWLSPLPWLETAAGAGREDVARALGAAEPGIREFAALLSPAAGHSLEALAHRAQTLTRRHFGRVVSLYAPLYLSNYCSSGCAYCGFASDRHPERRKLSPDEVEAELAALKQMGLEEVLLLTGERTPLADYDYLRDCVRRAAAVFPNVAVEVFPMSEEEYRGLAAAGCTAVTLYQETYDPARYELLHRWGPKRDYSYRLEAPARALAGGMRTAGLGALLGLADPVFDMLCLYRHATHLQRRFWKGGVTLSFPRVRPEPGCFRPESPVSESLLAQIICAFRICLPETPLVLSTRESARFRDGMAGIGVCRMSVASLTTVGGYHAAAAGSEGQFAVSDGRDVAAFCAALEAKGLQPVFKNWDAVYRGAADLPAAGA